MIVRGGCIELEHDEPALLTLACCGDEAPALDAALFSAWLARPVSEEMLAIRWGALLVLRGRFAAACAASRTPGCACVAMLEPCSP